MGEAEARVLTVSKADSLILALPGQGHMCQVCSFVSPNRLTIKRHVEGLHVKSSSFLCFLCGRPFNTENNRQIHVKRNHGMTYTAKQLREMDAKLKP